jgi:small conductance mechanosensitive channel
MFTSEATAQSGAKAASALPSLHELLSSFTDKAISFGCKLVVAVAVFYIGRFFINRLYSLVGKLLEKRNADPSLTTFLLSLINISLYFLLMIVVVGILGLETSSFIALFASAGVAVGMAMSGTLQNFAGGVLILLLKPYKIGEFIEAQGFTGTVKEIQIFSTILTTPDNKQIIIPNGPLSTGSINNYSREGFRRVDWTVCISYDNDFDQAQEAILDILRAEKLIIHNDADMAPTARLGEMADSSVNITVRAWVASENYWTVFYNVNEALFRTLPTRGVNFPYPQLDVHMHNE